MALIDVITYDGNKNRSLRKYSQGENWENQKDNVLVYKYPHTEFNTLS